MKRRGSAIFLAMALCLSLLPTVALAAEGDATISVGGVTLSASAPYAKTNESGEVSTNSEDETDYNLWWDADSATLTLKNANISVSSGAAISAALEKLTIKLEGENVITASVPAPQQREEEYAAVVNTGGSIQIASQDDSAAGSLEVSLTLTLTGHSDHVNCRAIAVKAKTDFSNSANVEVKVTGNDTVNYELTGIEIGDALKLYGGTFQNKGTLTVDVQTTGAEDTIAIRFAGVSFVNSGTITATAKAVRGNVDGIECVGNYSDITKSWCNSGMVSVDVESSSGRYANGILIADPSSPIVMTNQQAAAVTVKAVSSSVEANGIYLDSNQEITLTNSGCMNVEAENPVSACGICAISYPGNIMLDNNGQMNIASSTEENGEAYGVLMTLIYITDTKAHKTTLNLNSGSKLSITTSGSSDCMAIFQQRRYTASQAEGEAGEDQIYFNGTALQEEGKIYTEYEDRSNADSYVGYYYTTFIIGGDKKPLSAVHVISATPVEKVELNQACITLTHGGVAQLTAEITPDNATNKTVTWTSSDESVATVDQNGLVTAVGVGTAVITAQADNVSASCVVTVTKPSSGGSGNSSPTYPPDVTQPPEGGSVAVSPARPKKGDTVTITPKPDEGYEVDTITVTDRTGKPVEVQENPDGTFSFTQLTGKVTIEVTYKPTEVPWTSPFPDVSEDAWYADAVRFVQERGLMNGHENGLFVPAGTLTRAELAQILYNSEGKPAVGQGSFSDVTADSWYFDAVTWAASNGIVNGMTPTTYQPNAPITREQLATMLYRYAQAKGWDTTQGGMAIREFSDYESISDYAEAPMTWAVETGVLKGYENKTLRPQSTATRAEAAQMLLNFFSAQ